MGKYRTGNDLGGTAQNLSTAYKTIVTVIGAAASPRRSKIYDVLVGADGTPADNVLVWDISRMTADNGTKTNVTPTQLAAADAATTMLSRANFTAEGTITATSGLLTVPVNQRATFRWVAAPGGEIITPATASNGIALRAKSPAYVSTVNATIHFEE